jgi:hypothetical protein
MVDPGRYKAYEHCRVARRPREDEPDSNFSIHHRFAHDAVELMGHLSRKRWEKLTEALHNAALSYEFGNIDEDPDDDGPDYDCLFAAGDGIRTFLLEASVQLFNTPPGLIALTHFIGALCRLSPSWIAFFWCTEPFISLFTEALRSDIPDLALNALRIHHSNWKDGIRRRSDLDIPAIVNLIHPGPARGLAYGIETALVLTTLTAALPLDDAESLSRMAALLCGLLEVFPGVEILGPVGGAGTQLIGKGGAPYLVGDQDFLALFLSLLNRAAEETGGDEFPVDAFDFICQLVTSMDPAGRTGVFSSVVPFTHIAMLMHCGPEATERYLTAAAELVRTAPDVCTLLEDPLYFDLMRCQVKHNAFLRENAWLKFCLALIAKRGPAVLELLVTRGHVIKELSVAADGDDICEDYLHMIALLLEARLAIPDRLGDFVLDGEIANQIQAAIEDEGVGGLLMGFATCEEVPTECDLSDIVSVRQSLLELLQCRGDSQ